MRSFNNIWVGAVVIVLAGAIAYLARDGGMQARPVIRPDFEQKTRTHLDHSPFFTTTFSSPQEVTRACLSCHEKAAKEVMATAHWEWLGPAEEIPGRSTVQRIGKKNLLNNFCIGIQGNWAACTKCHAGYGWKDADYRFDQSENVDCLVCHDWTGTYEKGPAGLPKAGVDLLSVAKGVGYPKRENCGTCHNYGGGGLAVKHGDLDNSLDNPSASTDVHMGKYAFLCIDCHQTEGHQIRGRAVSVSVSRRNGVDCADCHKADPHPDVRLNAHLDSVACTTCHIPAFAREVPTKMAWDWSKAGDKSRAEDAHSYMKTNGEFVYGHNIVPEYRWYDGSVDRYLLGDRIDPEVVTSINRPRGQRGDPGSKIWPFKRHTATQPYDKGHRVLTPVVTAGKGGYWQEFDWDNAIRLAAEITRTPYSGKYGFARTETSCPE